MIIVAIDRRHCEWYARLRIYKIKILLNCATIIFKLLGLILIESVYVYIQIKKFPFSQFSFAQFPFPR